MKTDCTLDRLDVRILSQLQQRGRMTNVELAEAVGLSPSPCLTRVKRLEKAGFITGYGAMIKLEKLGHFQIVFAKITLVDHRREDFGRFIDAVRDIDEIMECRHATGGYDYLLKFVTRDIDHYHTLMEGLLKRDVGIATYFSYVIVESPIVKRRHRLEAIVAAK